MFQRPFLWTALLLLLLGAGWLLSEQRPNPPLRPGAAAPDFRLEALSGAVHALAEKRGRVVLVNFWATWCAPCEEEMPAMERLYRDLAPRGFELLAVSVDSDVEPVRAFRRRLALSFPILHDPGKEAASRYQVARFPETFLVDRRGVLVERYIGAVDWDAAAYRRRIERMLAGDS